MRFASAGLTLEVDIVSLLLRGEDVGDFMRIISMKFT